MRQPIYSPFKKPFFRNFKIQVKILKEPESKVFILDEDYFVDRLSPNLGIVVVDKVPSYISKKIKGFIK